MLHQSRWFGSNAKFECDWSKIDEAQASAQNAFFDENYDN